MASASSPAPSTPRRRDDGGLVGVGCGGLLSRGYRVTGALEAALATLKFLEVPEPLHGKALAKALDSGFIDVLSKSLNSPSDVDDLLKPIEVVAEAAGLDPLTHHKLVFVRSLLSKVVRLSRKVESVLGRRRRVYVALGHPLYAKRVGAYQVLLTEFVGCDCINRRLKRGDVTGPNADVEELTSLDPEVVIIDPHTLYTVRDFLRKAIELGIRVTAVRSGRVFKVPKKYRKLPYWPLMMLYIGRKVYPEIYSRSLLPHAQSILAPELRGITY